MKPFKKSTPARMETTVGDVCHWAHCLEELHARIAPRFARPEPRRRVLAYLRGVLSATERKNGWHLAQHAREATPYGMQRLLASAVWDAERVRDDLRTYVLEQLGTHEAILVIDETSFPKRGKHSAGVKRQYCGTTGQLENCQVGVFLDYVTAKGHTLIDRELYLPKRWIDDRERCREAGIPQTVRFHTKPELARLMIERVCAAHLSLAWVVADTVYGSNADLRTWLETQQYRYVLAVAYDEAIGIQTTDGRKRVTVAKAEALLVRAQDWHRVSMGQGSKGPRFFDWACVPMLHQWEDDGQHFLLIRRRLDDPTKKTYYLVFAPPGTTLAEMVKAIGARWHIEEDFEAAKDLGLDHYQVRQWIGWYRHVTLCLLAHAFLSGICAQEKTRSSPTAPEAIPLPVRPLLPLTVPEVRRLLGQLIWPPACSVKLILAWSWWRRCHRSGASYFHTKRRREAG
jgi:SRSO17 transposase